MRRFVHAWVICVCTTAALRAQTVEYIDAIRNIGSTTRVIEDGAVKIPVDVDIRHPHTTRPIVRHVTHEGTAKNSDTFTVELKKEDDTSYLVVTPATGATAGGKYTVRVTVPKLLRAAPKEEDAPSPSLAPLQTIDLTLTRGVPPKSAVVMPSPLKIQRVIQWNGKVTYEPKEWLMRETTGRAAIFPDPKVTRAHLISQTSSGLGLVRVTFPDVIEAAQEKRAEVALEGGPVRWIGDATATVMVRSDSLATPLMVYSVQVHSRYSWYWLLLTIAAGVVLGIITNRLLIPRIANMTARAKAAEERQRIIAIRATFIDVEIIAELDRIVATIDGALSNRRLKGDEVSTIANQAKTAADTVVTNARVQVKELTDRINAILESVRHPEAQTGTLRDLSYRATGRVQAFHALLTEGHLGSVGVELTELERDLPHDVAVAVPSWKKRIAGPLVAIGRWPDFAVDQDLAALLIDLQAVKEPETLAEVGDTLKATESIVRALRSGLGPLGFEEIHNFTREAIEHIERVVPNSLQLASLKEAEVAMRGFDNADLPHQLEAAAESVQTTRIALQRALAAAWRPTANDPATAPGLAEGDYKKALNAVRTQSPPPMKQAVVRPGVSSPDMDSAEAPHLGKIPPPPPGPWQFRLPSLPAAIRSAEDYAFAAATASWLRDVILAAFVIGGGMLIFMTTYIGTFADFIAALLWGFSVNLGAETVTQYASPLLLRRPFPR